MKSRCNKRKVTHKYGIEVPTSIEHGCALDEKNGDNYWRDALSKEMKNVGIAFLQVLDQGQDQPVEWSKVMGHIIFDVKMDFTRKARWVLDGHKTPNPIRIHICWCGIQGDCVNSTDLCGTKRLIRCCR
jgi:hypothetical protein